MKPVVFHPSAQRELQEAVRYYDEQSLGLGRDLNQRVKLATETISNHPTRFAYLRRPPYRAVRLKRFPYLLIYVEFADRIWVVAVAHDKRRPDYWRHRMPA